MNFKRMPWYQRFWIAIYPPARQRHQAEMRAAIRWLCCDEEGQKVEVKFSR
jgi:hypothetical protein